jgi:hypothetical protein
MGQITAIKTDRRLRKAMQYVSDYWLPANPELTHRIRIGIETGAFDDDRHLLVRELSSDLSLFFGCIRTLRAKLAERGEPVSVSPDLTQIIEDADLATLHESLQSVLSAPCIHLFSEGEEPEMSRLFESIISIASAEVLAPAYGTNVGAASSIAALRQLGYALVAWNYPTVYREALEMHQQDPEHHSLDLTISETLGFTPLLLASKLAASWGLPKELQDAAIDPLSESGESALVVSATAQTLRQICHISEMLARAQLQDKYPSARSDWESAIAEVERRLGPQGIERIRDRCATATAVFLSTSPDTFRPGLLLEQQFPKAVGVSFDNPYLPGADLTLQKKLAHLYDLIPKERASAKALQYLVRDVIPAGRFTGGCVFTVDPTVSQLMPQLDVGPTRARQCRPIGYMVDDFGEDPILLAYLTSDGCKPVVVEDNRSNVCCITAAFGRSQRLGVLYLELPLETYRLNATQVLLHFQAILHALVDSLGL